MRCHKCLCCHGNCTWERRVWEPVFLLGAAPMQIGLKQSWNFVFSSGSDRSGAALSTPVPHQQKGILEPQSSVLLIRTGTLLVAPWSAAPCSINQRLPRNQFLASDVLLLHCSWMVPSSGLPCGALAVVEVYQKLCKPVVGSRFRSKGNSTCFTCLINFSAFFHQHPVLTYINRSSCFLVLIYQDLRLEDMQSCFKLPARFGDLFFLSVCCGSFCNSTV